MVPPLGTRFLTRRPSGSTERVGRHSQRPVVLLTEQEHGVRARIVLLGANAVGTDGWTPAAVDLLTRHTAPLELLIGETVMRLLGGVELLETLRRAQPSVPVLLVSAAQWQRAGGKRTWMEISDSDSGIPFDAEVVLSYLDQLQRLADAA